MTFWGLKLVKKDNCFVLSAVMSWEMSWALYGSGKERSPEKLVDFQGQPSPNTGTVHTNNLKNNGSRSLHGGTQSSWQNWTIKKHGLFSLSCRQTQVGMPCPLHNHPTVRALSCMWAALPGVFMYFTINNLGIKQTKTKWKPSKIISGIGMRSQEPYLPAGCPECCYRPFLPREFSSLELSESPMWAQQRPLTVLAKPVTPRPCNAISRNNCTSQKLIYKTLQYTCQLSCGFFWFCLAVLPYSTSQHESKQLRDP